MYYVETFALRFPFGLFEQSVNRDMRNFTTMTSEYVTETAAAV